MIRSVTLAGLLTLALGTASAVAAGAPTVTTGPASSVTTSSATVAGTVNPNGPATTYSFEYGTTTGYGQQTPSASAGTGSSDMPETANLSGLTPNTTYHYRITATNSSGTSTGADQTFTTNGPPTVTTGAATAVTVNTATLAATVNAHGQATTYTFQYGTTTGYGAQTPSASAGTGSSDTPEMASVTGLMPRTTYHYRVSATNASGTVTGSDQTFTTASPPTVVTGLPQASDRHDATITGTINPNGGVTTYVFEYGLSAGYGLQTRPVKIAASTSTQNVVAAIHGLQSNRRFHYRLVAENPSGRSLGMDRTFVTGPSRLSPLRLTASTLPVRASVFPYRFDTSGMLVVPAGVSHIRACSGFVAIRFKQGANTISLRRVRLTRSCTYNSHVTFRIPRRVRNRALHVNVLFSGNGVLNEAHAPAQTVLAG